MEKLRLLVLAVCILVIIACKNKKQASFTDDLKFVTSDLANFYNALESISETSDTITHPIILNSEFLSKASIGQKRMIEARRYTPEEYINSILTKPKFWNSIKNNINSIETFKEEIRKGIEKLQNIYPDLTYSTIYFTIGNHRSPGTGIDSMVLLGTEFALGDSTTVLEELPQYNQDYYDINPINHLQFLSVHEYVHTQQKPMVHNLLSLTLYEGIAEFSAITATRQNSPWKAFTYGPENEKKILEKFESDMFKPSSIYNWLWNSPDNEFGTSELGYFIGHQLASRYYQSTKDKRMAIKKLIELDYNNEKEVEDLVNSTKLFSTTLASIEQEYEKLRPTVKGIKQFKNKSQSVDSKINEITIEFSKPLNGYNTGIDYGELGESAFPKNDVNGRYWGEDGSDWTIPVELESNKHYQLLITNNFRTENGEHLKPFLIEFKTK